MGAGDEQKTLTQMTQDFNAVEIAHRITSLQIRLSQQDQLKLLKIAEQLPSYDGTPTWGDPTFTYCSECGVNAYHHYGGSADPMMCKPCAEFTPAPKTPWVRPPAPTYCLLCGSTVEDAVPVEEVRAVLGAVAGVTDVSVSKVVEVHTRLARAQSDSAARERVYDAEFILMDKFPKASFEFHISETPPDEQTR